MDLFSDAKPKLRKPKKRWFVLLYPEQGDLKLCLDAMIYFARYDEKDVAHITIRGPFSMQSRTSRMASKLVGQPISIIGAGFFFGAKQSTIILKCGADNLRKFWKKGDYGFNPHLTIYDGTSRVFAEKLLATLSQHKLFFEVTIGECRAINSAPGQRSMKLRLALDDSRLSEILGEKIKLNEVPRMPQWRRLMYIDRLCSHITLCARSNSAENTHHTWNHPHRLRAAGE